MFDLEVATDAPAIDWFAEKNGKDARKRRLRWIYIRTYHAAASRPAMTSFERADVRKTEDGRGQRARSLMGGGVAENNK